MDVHDKLDELIALVENARSMPMSASCIVNRGDVLARLGGLAVGGFVAFVRRTRCALLGFPLDRHRIALARRRTAAAGPGAAPAGHSVLHNDLF